MSAIKRRSFNKVTGMTPTPSLRNIFNRDDTPDPTPIKEKVCFLLSSIYFKIIKKKINIKFFKDCYRTCIWSID